MNYTTPEQTFRHPDHKYVYFIQHRFEWTRLEFETWCLTQCEKYEYTVEFIGIGKYNRVEGEEGCCSQMAIFQRQTPSPILPDSLKTPYDLLGSITFPYYNPTNPITKDDIRLEFKQIATQILVRSFSY